MAKIYAPPAHLPAPKFENVSGQDYCKAVDEYTEAVVQWAKDNGKSDIRGEILRFGVADGCAMYVVYSLRPLTLIHVPIADAYQFPYIERLTVADIKERVRRK